MYVVIYPSQYSSISPHFSLIGNDQCYANWIKKLDLNLLFKTPVLKKRVRKYIVYVKL